MNILSAASVYNVNMESDSVPILKWKFSCSPSSSFVAQLREKAIRVGVLMQDVRVI